MTLAPREAHGQVTRVGRGELWLLLLVTAAAVGRVVSTYHVFTATYDEPVHLESGIGWLQSRTMRYDLMHPPLSRMLLALGPYLDGVRWQGWADWRLEGVAELHETGNYARTLALARLGVLPYFLLAIWSTWWLARLLYGPGPALAAAAILTLLPPVLAHAGIATTDMAITGMMPVVLLAAVRWLDEPDRRATLLLGAAVGVAVLSKFSALLFVPVAVVTMLLLKLAIEPVGTAVKLARWRRLELPAVGVLGAAFLLIWAGYAFHVGTLDSIRLADVSLGDVLPPSIASTRLLPAPEFWHGLVILLWYSDHMPAYALGKVTASGPWYFFPLAIGVKAPLGFLVLVVPGTVLAARQAWRERCWRLAVPPAVALALLLAASRSTIAIGGRHVLPLYPLLAILAGMGAVGMWRLGGFARVGAAALVVWLLGASVRAHPDYLADFNEIARKRPEHFLLTSDLDYGQDVGRLADTIRARGIDSITVYLFSFPDNRALGSPRHVVWPEWHHETPPPATGWIAASAWVLYGVPGIPWLREHRPVALVGRTIYLFYIPPGAEEAG